VGAPLPPLPPPPPPPLPAPLRAALQAALPPRLRRLTPLSPPAPAPTGLPKDAIRPRVAGGLRPAFPPGAPPEFARIADDCWSADPAARPGFPEICRRLQALIPEPEVLAALAATGAAAARAPPAALSPDLSGPFVEALPLRPAPRAAA
jgi:hypothetical protein